MSSMAGLRSRSDCTRTTRRCFRSCGTAAPTSSLLTARRRGHRRESPRRSAGAPTQAISKGQIDEVVEGFGAAARRAKQSGLDGVEVHGTHGYLVGSFLSPMTNLHTDEYGGDLERRARLAREALRSIRDARSGPHLRTDRRPVPRHTRRPPLTHRGPQGRNVSLVRQTAPR
jgi:hypothetical protein